MLTVLHLKREATLLGTLNVYDYNLPWISCRFEPTAAFEKIRSLFDEELQVLNTQDLDSWAEAYRAIAELHLRLEDPTSGGQIDEFILHIRDDEAWFRY